MKLGSGWCRWPWLAATSSFYSSAPGLPGVRHQRAAAGAALVLLQQHLWRLSRSATAWAAAMTSIPAKVIIDWSKPLLDGGLGPGSASHNLIHQLQIVRPRHTALIWPPRSSSCRRRCRTFCSTARPARGGKLRLSAAFSAYLQADAGRVDLRSLSRLAAALHVRHAVPGLPGAAPASGEPGGQSQRHVHRRFHRAAGSRARWRRRARSS